MKMSYFSLTILTIAPYISQEIFRRDWIDIERYSSKFAMKKLENIAKDNFHS